MPKNKISNRFKSVFGLTVTLFSLICFPALANQTKPLIGINVDLEGETSKNASVPSPYYAAVEKSGGIPVLIPPMPEADLRALLKRLDGVMLIGGLDYPPAFYNQKAHPTAQIIDEERGNFDKLLTTIVVKETKIPFLGICAGSQILNIACGGSLIQDIPSTKPESTVAHRRKSGERVNTHVVIFNAGTKLASLYSDKKLPEPANHHQAVDKLGENLKEAAHTEDGIVEAVEMDSKPFVIGVQYHPERDYEHNQTLFKEFIKEATKYDEGADRALAAGK
jgi:putative glutamine amidotransferase